MFSICICELLNIGKGTKKDGAERLNEPLLQLYHLNAFGPKACSIPPLRTIMGNASKDCWPHKTTRAHPVSPGRGIALCKLIQKRFGFYKTEGLFSSPHPNMTESDNYQRGSFTCWIATLSAAPWSE